MDLETNMKTVGKRFPYYAKYTVRDKLICFIFCMVRLVAVKTGH